MSKTRYSGTEIIDDRSFGTMSIPSEALGFKDVDLLEGVRSFEYVIVAGDRIDKLAARFFNNDQYWWVIALVNSMWYPFKSGGFVPGRVLRIPVTPQDIFDKIFR
jgi:hypothetical protein